MSKGAFLENKQRGIDGAHVEALTGLIMLGGGSRADARERAQKYWDSLTQKQKDRLFALRNLDPCPTCLRSCKCEP